MGSGKVPVYETEVPACDQCPGPDRGSKAWDQKYAVLSGHGFVYGVAERITQFDQEDKTVVWMPEIRMRETASRQRKREETFTENDLKKERS